MNQCSIAYVLGFPQIIAVGGLALWIGSFINLCTAKKHCLTHLAVPQAYWSEIECYVFYIWSQIHWRAEIYNCLLKSKYHSESTESSGLLWDCNVQVLVHTSKLIEKDFVCPADDVEFCKTTIVLQKYHPKLTVTSIDAYWELLWFGIGKPNVETEYSIRYGSYYIQ